MTRLLVIGVIVVLVIRWLTRALNDMSDQRYMNVLGATCAVVWLYMMMSFLLFLRAPGFITWQNGVCVAGMALGAILLRMIKNKVREMMHYDPDLTWIGHR